MFTIVGIVFTLLMFMWVVTAAVVVVAALCRWLSNFSRRISFILHPRRNFR